MTTIEDTRSTDDGGALASPEPLFWFGPLAVEDAPTGDGRRVMPDALSWRDLPLPLMFQSKTPEGSGNPHAGAALSGRIALIWRDDQTVYGAGLIDTGDDGANLARFLADGPLGISVDLDDVDSVMECLETDADGECVEGELQLMRGRVMGATACPFPAIPAAQISLVSADQYATLTTEHAAQLAVETDDEEPHEYENSGDGTCVECGKAKEGHAAMTVVHAPLVAAAARMLPPETWFDDPGFTSVTPFTILDADEHGNRRCYGHAARWGQPHIALAGRTAPKSGSGYAYYRTGAVRASCECPALGGQVEIPVGTVTLGCGHMNDLRASAADAVKHYDDSGLAVAHVAAGEDEHGIWLAGVLVPDLTEERVVELRASSLSGDWRFIGGRLEMVACLAVNVPGFPVPRTAFHTSENRETALVAAGVVVPSKPVSFSDHAALESRLGILEAKFTQQSAMLRALQPVALAQLATRFGQ